jgi:hypothetical protein
MTNTFVKNASEVNQERNPPQRATRAHARAHEALQNGRKDVTAMQDATHTRMSEKKSTRKRQRQRDVDAGTPSSGQPHEKASRTRLPNVSAPHRRDGYYPKSVGLGGPVGGRHCAPR